MDNSPSAAINHLLYDYKASWCNNIGPFLFIRNDLGDLCQGFFREVKEEKKTYHLGQKFQHPDHEIFGIAPVQGYPKLVALVKEDLTMHVGDPVEVKNWDKITDAEMSQIDIWNEFKPLEERED